ncbi:MAG TPA: hypothetical protein VK465_13680 [Fibrobacteria bacterium]|nr:hypothetical protein [Fibrobacteria bacterium]
MEGSETPIQPGRASADRGVSPGTFQGTVSGVRQENGEQTVEIQGSHGRIKLKAEGEFQVGEKVRVLMDQGGAVRLEKAAPPEVGDWKGLSYTLPGNLVTLKELRAFEENLARWIGSRPPGVPAPDGKGTLAGGDVESLLRLPLPELLKRVLAREGGRETLTQALAGLGREGFAALMDGLEEGGTQAGGSADGAKAGLLQLLRALRREADPCVPADPAAPRSAGTSPQAALHARGNRDLGIFWPSRPAAPAPWAPPSDAASQSSASRPTSPALPWMGRVLGREEMGASLTFAGGKPVPPMAQAPGVEGAPIFRYLLDLGEKTLTVQSAQTRGIGELVDFEMEAPGNPGAAGAQVGGRLQARFLDPAQTLPPGLRGHFSEAGPEGKAALQVAARYLSDLRGEPYFEDLVKDFGEVLAQSGRLAQPPEGIAPRAGQLPAPKELDTLLRLFVAFPRDAEQPERQAKVWSEAARDPQALQDLLKALRPAGETSLLRVGTALRAAGPGLPPDLLHVAGEAVLAAAGSDAGDRPEEVFSALLRRALPDAFKSPDLLELARQGTPPGGAEGKEAQAAKFMLQAFAGLVPREEEMREGRPAQFYFYQGQEWRGLQVTWERDKEGSPGKRRETEAPVKVRVETEARAMGKVDVGVILRGDRAFLDFKNQFHDVRELLAADLPELEKSLNLLGVYLEGWTYSRMQEPPQIPPTAGWVRPAFLDGANLDLMG